MTAPNYIFMLAPGTRSVQVLSGEIPGVSTALVSLQASDIHRFTAQVGLMRVLVLYEGSAQVDVSENEGDQSVSRTLDRMFTVCPGPDQHVKVQAIGQCHLLDIQWTVSEAEIQACREESARFPLVLDYVLSSQYRDYFKSEKTISRTIIGPRTLPRFCMGSVESNGPDRIEPHAHPMLDQLFFSLVRNDITLLIDGTRQSLGPTSLLHIPLGSEHGVEVSPGAYMHYLWLDFFKSDEQMAYLEEVHKDVPSRTLEEG
jgi:hypothetical protein